MHACSYWTWGGQAGAGAGLGLVCRAGPPGTPTGSTPAQLPHCESLARTRGIRNSRSLVPGLFQAQRARHGGVYWGLASGNGVAVLHRLKAVPLETRPGPLPHWDFSCQCPTKYLQHNVVAKRAQPGTLHAFALGALPRAFWGHQHAAPWPPPTHDSPAPSGSSNPGTRLRAAAGATQARITLFPSLHTLASKGLLRICRHAVPGVAVPGPEPARRQSLLPGAAAFQGLRPLPQATSPAHRPRRVQWSGSPGGDRGRCVVNALLLWSAPRERGAAAAAAADDLILPRIMGSP